MSDAIKQIHIEKIAKAETFLHTPQLTKAEVEKAIQEVLKQIDLNMDYFQERFPFSCTKDLKYPIIDNIEWTDGFWTGMLWLAYEYTKDDKYRALAEKNVDSFYHRIKNNIEVDHHDLGFLYSLSCVSAYKITGNEKAKEAALMAADKLLTRFQEKGQFIQAWGEYNNPKHYRFIIDCMLNLPLLYWASEVSGNNKYVDIAKKHFETNCKYIIRDDASAYHTYYMDPLSGEPVRGATHQGYNDTSSWARGQAWGVYGFPLNYRYTKDKKVVPLYKGMTNYFLNRLPEDNVSYWDLIFNDDAKQSRDSSAAAISVCGMMEMDKYLGNIDVDKAVYHGACDNILRSLIHNYTSRNHEPGDPILYHGVYSWHSGKGVDEGNIWGDYYYFEALMRYTKDWNLYW
ncbi:MAG: glycoside hydrolase family 88 protein [Erysipelotrichaceae bacterium]